MNTYLVVLNSRLLVPDGRQLALPAPDMHVIHGSHANLQANVAEATNVTPVTANRFEVIVRSIRARFFNNPHYAHVDIFDGPDSQRMLSNILNYVDNFILQENPIMLEHLSN